MYKNYEQFTEKERPFLYKVVLLFYLFINRFVRKEVYGDPFSFTFNMNVGPTRCGHKTKKKKRRNNTYIVKRSILRN